MSDTDQTFLELCVALAREVGVPESGPTTVVAQTGELEKIVRYIQDADMDIKRRYIDWKFLWLVDFSVSLTTNDQTVTSSTSGWPTSLGTWNPDAFVLDATADTFQELTYIDYDLWRRRYSYGTHNADTPQLVTIKPDKSLALYPKADGAYTLTGEYWKKAVKMTANSDTSDIPAEFRRLIVVRAKLLYAEHEDAPEISQGAGAEHDDLLDQMIAQYAPDQEVKRHFRAPASRQVVVMPL